MAALQRFGVYPRVSYAEPNDKILTISRKDEDNGIFYTYAYYYKFKDTRPYTVTLVIEGEGKPYYIDDWTGDIGRIGVYDIKGGRTYVTLTLEPGESKIIALDLDGTGTNVHTVSTSADAVRYINGRPAVLATVSGDYYTVLSNGKTVKTSVTVPNDIMLKTWDITVEDWNEGNRVVNTEAKFCHTTKEVYFTTRKTELKFKDIALAPWKDLPATAEQLTTLGYENPSMSHISGIGTYTTTFEIPAVWTSANGAYLSIESAGGGTVAVYVNGEKAPGVNTRTLKVDISDLLRPGRKNTIQIEVASTLTNRLIQRGFFGWMDKDPSVRDYGLVGDVRIVPYTVIAID
jgi:hypothetical protein